MRDSRRRDTTKLDFASARHQILCRPVCPKDTKMATVKVEKSNFKSDVLDAKEPVVVDFWA